MFFFLYFCTVFNFIRFFGVGNNRLLVMNDRDNVAYCWNELNRLLDYLMFSKSTDSDKVRRAKAVAFDICIKFGKDYENENR